MDTAPFAQATVKTTSTIAAGSLTLDATPNPLAPDFTNRHVYVNGVDTGFVVNADSGIGSLTLAAGTSPAPTTSITLKEGDTVIYKSADGTISDTATVSAAVTIRYLALDANPVDNVKDKRVFLNGVDTGYVVASDPGGTSPLILAAGTSPAPDASIKFTEDDIVTFYDAEATLNMTLVTPDGHEILVQGKSNKPKSGLDLTAVESRVEVYSSIDGRFFDHDSPADYYSNRQASKDEMQVSASAYKPVTVMHFVGGRNIDALVTDPLSGNPKFRTDVTLSAKVTNQALGTSQLVFNLDLTDTTMQSGPFQISKSYQDGEAFAKLSNLTIDNEGRIAGVYGGGRVQYVGQIALVHFDAFEAMAPVGKNAFAATVESGTEDSANGVYRGRPGTGQLGEIRSQALESSNVDLSGELVRLMILQRTYSANSQSMKAVDQVMRDTLQMIS